MQSVFVKGRLIMSIKDKELILSLIPKGRENAISRQELKDITGLDDRRIRLIIKELTKTYDIISSSSVKGYWISEDDAEIRKFLIESDNRSRTEYFNTEPIRRRYYARQSIRTVSVRGYLRKVPKQEDARQISL